MMAVMIPMSFVLLLVSSVHPAIGFVSNPADFPKQKGSFSSCSPRSLFSITQSRVESSASLQTRLFAGGFGGGGNKSNDIVPKKLKPKQQWDRYQSLKKETKIRVAVRCKEGESDEWLEVGRVKSQDNKYTYLAVARQRALIAEHAKRLYPLQVSTKKTLEWGYYHDKDETWKIVDKSILEDDSNQIDGLDKLIGFEGRPDPATGFYCVYDGGRLKLGEESSFK